MFPDVEIAQLVRIFRVGGLYQLQEQKHRLQTLIQAGAQRSRLVLSLGARRRLETQLARNTSKLEGVRELIGQLRQNIKFEGSAFVIFRRRDMANRLYARLADSKWSSYFIYHRVRRRKQFVRLEDQILQFRRAPEPSDIIWQHLGAENLRMYLIRLLEFFLHIVFLATSAGIFVLLEKFQDMYHDRTKGNTSFASYVALFFISLSVSVVVMVVVFVGKLVINRLAVATHCVTHSEQDQTILSKLLHFNMSCSVITPFYFAVIQNVKKSEFWIPNLYFLVAFSTFSHLSYRLVNPSYFFTAARRLIMEKYAGYRGYHQERLNEIYTNERTNVPDLLSNCDKIFLFAIVYAQFFPLIPLLCLFALAITYWCDRYLILYKWSEPHYQSDAIFLKNKGNMSWKLLCFSLITQMTYLYDLVVSKTQISSILAQVFIFFQLTLNVLYFGFFFFLDKKQVLYYENHGRAQQKPLRADDFNAYEFENDYSRCNPVTNVHANQRYVAYRQELESDDERRSKVGVRGSPEQNTAVGNASDLRSSFFSDSIFDPTDELTIQTLRPARRDLVSSFAIRSMNPALATSQYEHDKPL